MDSAIGNASPITRCHQQPGASGARAPGACDARLDERDATIKRPGFVAMPVTATFSSLELGGSAARRRGAASG